MRLNVGMSLELVGLDTYNLGLYLGALQLRYRFLDLKENEKVTQQIKLQDLRPISLLVFLVCYGHNRLKKGSVALAASQIISWQSLR